MGRQYTTSTILQSAAAASANGTILDISGMASVSVQVTGTFTATVYFEQTIDGSNWVAVQGANVNSGAVGSTATAAGIFTIPVAGTLFRARVDWSSGTSVTVTAYTTIIGGGMSLADIDIAAEEASTIADGADVAQGTTTDAAASSTVAEDTTARTSVGLWKAIKNILILINAKFVTGTDIGDVTVNNAADDEVYIRGGGTAGSATDGEVVAVQGIASGTPMATTESSPLTGFATSAKQLADGHNVVIAAGEAHIGEVGGSSINVTVTPTITAGAYTALDTIGGIQTIAGAARSSGVPTTLQSIIIKDLAMVSPNFKIWFFNANPGTGTYTDNAALDIDDTDLGLCVGVVNCANGEWVNGLDNGVLIYSNVGLVMTPAATSLFAVVETVDAETFITTSDLTFIYGFYRD